MLHLAPWASQQPLFRSSLWGRQNWEICYFLLHAEKHPVYVLRWLGEKRCSIGNTLPISYNKTRFFPSCTLTDFSLLHFCRWCNLYELIWAQCQVPTLSENPFLFPRYLDCVHHCLPVPSFPPFLFIYLEERNNHGRVHLSTGFLAGGTDSFADIGISSQCSQRTKVTGALFVQNLVQTTQTTGNSKHDPHRRTHTVRWGAHSLSGTEISNSEATRQKP